MDLLALILDLFLDVAGHVRGKPKIYVSQRSPSPLRSVRAQTNENERTSGTDGLQVPVTGWWHSMSSAKSAAVFPSLEEIKVWMIFHCLPN